jgi:hypothetical protein
MLYSCADRWGHGRTLQEAGSRVAGGPRRHGPRHLAASAVRTGLSAMGLGCLCMDAGEQRGDVPRQ